MEGWLKLSDGQLKSLGEVCKDIGQVLFAGLVVTQMISEEVDWIFYIFSLMSSLVFWHAYIEISRRTEL